MHFYVYLSIGLWIYMYLFVDCTEFACGLLHTVLRLPAVAQSVNAFFQHGPICSQSNVVPP